MYAASTKPMSFPSAIGSGYAGSLSICCHSSVGSDFVSSQSVFLVGLQN